MSLLSGQDREVVRRHLAALQTPVTILFFTQTIAAPETSLVTRQVLDEIAGLSDHVSIEEVNFVLDRDRAQQYGIEHIPALVLLSGDADSRLRFIGAPAGYEFSSLIEGIVLAGTSDSGLTPESRDLIAAHITAPTDIRVFVTPTCPHCPRAVTLANRIARENQLVQATCVEASEFIDLARRFRVTGVPKTVVNDSVEILGALPEDLFVRTVLGLPETDSPGSVS